MEDDHAGAIAGAPYVSLTRGRARWVVVRSVSKWLGPDLRLAVMTGDAATLARVSGQQTLGIRWVSHILQKLVVQLWSASSTSKLLRRAEGLYAQRRESMLRALAARGIDARGASGLNIWIPLIEESSVVQALFQRGWAVQAAERYRIESGPAIRVTVATMDESAAIRFAADLRTILAPGTRATDS